MAVAASNQTLKILSDLDIDLMDVDNDKGYLRALMEATNKLTITNASDNRIPILQKEIKRVRNKRKAASPSRGMKITKKKINVNKFVDRKTSTASVGEKSTAAPQVVIRQPAQRVQPQALLPPAKDPQRNIMDKLGDGLNNILKSAKGLLQVDKNQLSIDKKTAKDSKKTQQKADKADREKELEKKKKGETDQPNKVGSALKKPFTGFFDTIKTFFGNILAGSIVVKVVDWLKNPENSESIEKFKNMIVDNFPLIVGGILAVAALPVVATLVGFTSMLLGGIGLLAPLIPFLLKAMLAAAAIIAVVKAGQWLGKKFGQAQDWAHDRLSGGQASGERERLNAAELEKVGVAERGGGLSSKFNQFKIKDESTATGWRGVGYDDLNTEQKAAVDKMREDRKRMNALEKERKKEIQAVDKEIKGLRNTSEYGTTKGRGRGKTRVLNEAGVARKAELEEKKKQIVAKYGEAIRTGGKFPPPSKTEETKKEDTKLDKASGLEQQAAQLKTDTSEKLQMQKTIPSKGIDRELTGEGQVDFLNLGGAGDQAQDQGGIAASSGGSSASPSFSSVDSNVNTLLSKSLYSMWV